MVAGAVLRRDQEHEDVHRLGVDRLERYAVGGDGHGADQAVDAVVLGVGDGDAAADAGRAELLALEDGPDDVVGDVAGDVAGGAQAVDDLADHRLLRGGGQGRDDRLADHEIGHRHD